MTLVGVDGCTGGWVCVAAQATSVTAFVVPSIEAALARIQVPAVMAVDVPIGLTDAGPRLCDVAARRLLGQPRGTSVFPAPVRAALAGRTHAEASELHEQADGRRLTLQAFGILQKIHEVDALLSRDPSLQNIVREIHPELSFAVWNAGQPMKNRKSRAAGRSERETLIEDRWPGQRAELVGQLRGSSYKPDDLNDALAALWTAERIHSGAAKQVPAEPPRDRLGLRMEMWA
jgi:predicted RNase H-like nuclease